MNLLTWLRWLAYVLVFVSAILTALAISQLSKARRAPFYVLRKAVSYTHLTLPTN